MSTKSIRWYKPATGYAEFDTPNYSIITYSTGSLLKVGGTGPYDKSAIGFHIYDTNYDISDFKTAANCTLKINFTNATKTPVTITLGIVPSSYQIGGVNSYTGTEYYNLISSWTSISTTHSRGNVAIDFSSNAMLILKQMLNTMLDTDWLYIGFTSADAVTIRDYGYPNEGSIKLLFSIPDLTDITGVGSSSYGSRMCVTNNVETIKTKSYGAKITTGRTAVSYGNGYKLNTTDTIKTTRHGATVNSKRTDASYGAECGILTDTIKVKPYGYQVRTNRTENSYGG